MKTFSEVTQRYYEPSDCVYILNLKQAGLYIKHGAKIYDVLWSRGSLVFVFSREETKTLFDLWCKRELT